MKKKTSIMDKKMVNNKKGILTKTEEHVIKKKGSKTKTVCDEENGIHVC